MSIRKFIGYAILAGLFAIVFAWGISDVGVAKTIASFIIAGLVVALVLLAVHLIQK